jgi:hypothetical protein
MDRNRWTRVETAFAVHGGGSRCVPCSLGSSSYLAFGAIALVLWIGGRDCWLG